MLKIQVFSGLLATLLIAGCAYADLDVMDYGAKGDGVTDDTAAFQSALDAAAPKGEVVVVPAGTYLIEGSLNIPQSVTLKGSWQAPHFSEADKGSLIIATGNAGNENGTPLINLVMNSCIEGFTIFYPDQDPRDVKPYPWTIQGRGTHCSVIDVTLVNPYKGIDFGTFPNEMHYIRNVYGCPLKIGIFVDKCTDIGRIENVHFNPNSYTRLEHPNAAVGDKAAALVEYLHQNLIGFLFGRTDWEYVNNSFVIFPKIGFHFTDAGGGGGNVLLTQSGADICGIAVQVDATQSHAGVSFSNSQFFGRIIIGETNTGPVRFTACGFYGAADDTANEPCHVDSKGNGHVSLDNCHFIKLWGNNNTKIDIRASGGKISVNNCYFMMPDRTNVLLEEGLKTAIIACNTFVGKANIVNNANANVQIGLNVDETPKPEEPGSIVIDDSSSNAFVTEGEWQIASAGSDYGPTTRWAKKGNGECKAWWKPDLPKAGRYAVYVWYGGDPANDHATNAPYIVKYKDGQKEIRVNLKTKIGQWVHLGDFEFSKGQSGYVMTTNDADGNVVADAVKFVPID